MDAGLLRLRSSRFKKIHGDRTAHAENR